MRSAARRLGSSRIEWVAVPRGAFWVALPGPLGEEAAALVGNVASPDDATEEPVPARPLRAEEIAQLPLLVERALALLRALGSVWAGRIHGIRPALRGGVVLELTLSAAEDAVRLEHSLAERHGIAIRVVPTEPDRALHGGLGPLALRNVALESVLARLTAGLPARPSGYPRIGALVHTPAGPGTVQAVRTRDRTVLVRVGEELVRFAVDALSETA